MDNDRKIEIQQKLIEKLTIENEELKNQLLSIRTETGNSKQAYENSIKEMEKAKNRYDLLVEELEELKIKYRTYYDIYKKLTE